MPISTLTASLHRCSLYCSHPLHPSMEISGCLSLFCGDSLEVGHYLVDIETRLVTSELDADGVCDTIFGGK